MAAVKGDIDRTGFHCGFTGVGDYLQLLRLLARKLAWLSIDPLANSPKAVSLELMVQARFWSILI
jgi:hypothetical protein